MHALWGYARDLFQTPGFGDAADFVQINQHCTAGPGRTDGPRPHGVARFLTPETVNVMSEERVWGQDRSSGLAAEVRRAASTLS